MTVTATIATDDDGHDPARRLHAALERFAALVAAGADRADRRSAGFDLLAIAAEVGLDGWIDVLDSDLRPVIEDACTTPDEHLDLLELLAFAPESTGLPAEARVRAEEFGHRHAAECDLARTAERLLHILGAPDAAYRVERARKATERGGRSGARRSTPTGDDPELAGLVVLVAGGHPALRARIEADLRRLGGGTMREIPAAWEATRRERDVRALVAGVDIVVMIGRQIAHSTVDQVKTAATAATVPVVVAETAGAGAVRRAIARHLETRIRDRPRDESRAARLD